MINDLDLESEFLKKFSGMSTLACRYSYANQKLNMKDGTIFRFYNLILTGLKEESNSTEISSITMMIAGTKALETILEILSDTNMAVLNLRHENVEIRKLAFLKVMLFPDKAIEITAEQ